MNRGSEAPRREIDEGLNIVEQWNGATDFVFFAKRGELASNRRADQEVSMLSLHPLQNCLVYINTLMMQRIRLLFYVMMPPRATPALVRTVLAWSSTLELSERQMFAPLDTTDGFGIILAKMPASLSALVAIIVSALLPK